MRFEAMARRLDTPAWEENVGALAVPVSSMRARIRRRAAKTRRACLTKALRLRLRRHPARSGDVSCLIAARVEDFVQDRGGGDFIEPIRSGVDRRQCVNSGGLVRLVFPEPAKKIEILVM
jgi:hypothetical protein